MPEIAHFAINADDVQRGRKFYESVFGWTFSPWGPPDFYQIDTGGLRGAMQARRELLDGQRTIGFECTIAVDSIDATENAVSEAGGKVVMARSIIVGVGTLVFFEDTEGNVFGAMEYNSDVE